MIYYKTGSGIKFFEEIDVLMKSKMSMLIRDGSKTRIISTRDKKFQFWDNRKDAIDYLKEKAETSMARSMKFVFKKGDELAEIIGK